MHVISLIHSLPLLDLVLALVSELQAAGRTGKMTTVLHFGGSTRAANADFLLRLICQTSDNVFALGRNPLYEELRRLCSQANLNFTCKLNNRAVHRLVEGQKREGKLGGYLLNASLDQLFDSIKSDSVLLRSHADNSAVSRRLGEIVRARGGRVLAMLEGCYPPHNSLPLSYFGNARPDLVDKFLMFAEGYREPLASVGFSNLEVIGFPKLYPAWRNTVATSDNLMSLRRELGAEAISLFTRGETADPGPQIMSNQELLQILTSVIETVTDVFPGAPVVIKPHPAQDRGPIHDVERRYENVVISEEHPSVLALNSKLVVTTWSTSIFDSLAFGIPSVEYFLPNEHFLNIYPAGSAFKNLGIPSVANVAEFDKLCQSVASGSYQQPDLARLFEHEANIAPVCL